MTTINPNNLESFDEFTKYFTDYPLAWYDKKFLDKFLDKYKCKIHKIVDLFRSVGRTKELSEDLMDIFKRNNPTIDSKAIEDMIIRTEEYLVKRKDRMCGVCGIWLTRENVAGHGSCPPDCSLCYIMLCSNCAQIVDCDAYCKQCFEKEDEYVSFDETDRSDTSL